jgi:WD40 repeat protein
LNFTKILLAIKNARVNSLRWVDAFWGYDVFIAHRRADAAEYARGLYKSLTDEKISCFIDRVVYGPGDSLLVATARHVTKSTLFLLVGSPELLAARRPIDWIEKEIETYLSSHDDPKVILIDFGATIANALASPGPHNTSHNPLLDRLLPYLRISEDLAALAKPPSENVLGAVRRNLDGRRRDRNRLWFFEGVATVLAILFLVAGGLYLYADKSLKQAQLSQSQFLADQSSRATDGGNAEIGLLLASAALPNGDKDYPIERPVSADALLALYKATQSVRETATFFHDPITSENKTQTPPQMAKESDFNNEVYKAEFSPNSSHLLTVAENGTARLWDVASRTFITVYSSPNRDYPFDADFSPDGNRIAIGVTDGSIHLFNRETGKLITGSTSHDQVVQRVRFSPTGKLIATASSDYSVRLWSADDLTPEKLPIPIIHQGPVYDVAFSIDGTKIVSSSRVGPPIVTSLRDYTQIKLIGHDDAVFQSEFSPDGNCVVTASADRTARLWSAADGEPLAIMSEHTAAVSRARFSPTGPYVVTASRDGTARLWRISDGCKTAQPIAVLRGHTDRLYDVKFSNSGLQVITVSRDGTAMIWNLAERLAAEDLQTKGSFPEIINISPSIVLSGHTSWVYSGVFSKDDSIVATASRDGTARIWSATEPKTVQRIAAHSSPITRVIYDRQGRRMLTGAHDGTVKLWDINSLTVLNSFEGHQSSITAADFDLNGQHIVTGDNDGRVILWNTEHSESPTILMDSSDAITSVHFSPDGKAILTTSKDKTARLFDSANGKQLGIFQGHTSWINGGAFSADERSILTWSLDGTARLWNRVSGVPIQEIKLCDHPGEYAGSIELAAFHPIRKEIVAACIDGRLAIWSGVTSVRYFGEHKKAIRSFSFSPDGTKLVTASDDKSAKVWDALNWSLIGTLTGHETELTFASFSANGASILTGAYDRSARLWDARTLSPEAIFSGENGTVVAAAIDRRNQRAVTVSGRELLAFPAFETVQQLTEYAGSLATRGLSCVERSRFGLAPGPNCTASDVK